MKSGEKGITLVALIITIIILLILAVVSIMAVTGTGLFAKTSEAVDKYQNSTEKENFIMDDYATAIDNHSGETSIGVGPYNITFKNLASTLTDEDWAAVLENGMVVAFYPSTYSNVTDAYNNGDITILGVIHDAGGGIAYFLDPSMSSGEYYLFEKKFGAWRHGTIGVDNVGDLPAYTAPITVTNVKIATAEEMESYGLTRFTDSILGKIISVQGI